MRYEKEFTHVLQTSELWSQMANTSGTETSERRYSVPTTEVKIFPEVNHARKIQQQTLSEPLSDSDSQNHTVLWTST